MSTRQGEFLRGFGLDLLLLQEVNPRTLPALAEAAGLDWAVSAADLRVRPPGEGSGRRRASAVAGRGPRPLGTKLFTHVRLPERLLVVEVPLAQQVLTAASYHAPPGVSWGRIKVDHAVALADWLETVSGPIVVGADANTPEVDHPDADLARTHWHSGSRRLDPDEPGDDVMFGGRPRHRLRDALRRWYDDHPEEAAALRRERPEGPLAISHRTGRRNSSPGTPRRYDHLWVTPEFDVEVIDYHYEEAVEAGSDHALVLADLRLDAPGVGG